MQAALRLEALLGFLTSQIAECSEGPNDYFLNAIHILGVSACRLTFCHRWLLYGRSLRPKWLSEFNDFYNL